MRARAKTSFVKEAIANLNQAANTYDLVTAQGDLIILAASFYVQTAGGGLTSVSFQTNQTNATIFLTAVEGAVALLVVQKNLAFAFAGFPIQLRNGQKVQYTIVGVGNAGEIKADFLYRGVPEGAAVLLV